MPDTDLSVAQAATFFRLTLFYWVSFLALCYLGYGFSRLLLPPEWQRHRFFVAPLLGYCVLTISASFLTSTVASMSLATPLILWTATGLNLASLFLRKNQAQGNQGVREVAFIYLLAFAAFLLGTLPLIRAGSVIFVGLQWDLELYLPIAEYLKRYVIGSTLTGPESPLLAPMNAPAFRGGSGWGFSFFESFIGIVLGWMSYETFRPSLHFMLGLSVFAVYLFCRLGLRLSPSSGVIAALLTALNGTNLWVASSGLAGHAVTFFTLPFAFTLTVRALDSVSPRRVLLASIAVSGMLLSYYSGALFLYASGMALVVLPRLLWGKKARGRTYINVVAITCLVNALSFVGYLRFLEVLPLYWRQGFTPGWHVLHFISLGEAIGLTPDRIIGDRIRLDQLWEPQDAHVLRILVLMAMFIIIVACRLALSLPRWRRLVFLELAVGCWAIAMCLLLVFPYPYGYFKVLSLSSFLLAVALARVLVALWNEAALVRRALTVRAFIFGFYPVTRSSPMQSALPGPQSWVFRAWGLITVTLVVGLLSINTLLTLRFFSTPALGEPVSHIWEFRSLRSFVPDGETVYVAGNSGLSPQEKGILAYFLLDYPLVGSLTTAYGRLNSDLGGSDYRYIILPSVREPGTLDLSEAERVWSNELVDVYRKGP